MSRYDSDPRVVREADGSLTVDIGRDFTAWVCGQAGHHSAFSSASGLKIGGPFATEDEAIAAAFRLSP